MQKTNVLERPSTTSQPEKAVKWRNVYFDKSGKSYNGILLFETLEQAQERIREQLAQISGPNTDPKYSGWQIPTMDGMLPADDYAWSMQIPILME